MAIQYEQQSREIDSRCLENPVSAYLILKRLAQGWIMIEEAMRRDDFSLDNGKYFRISTYSKLQYHAVFSDIFSSNDHDQFFIPDQTDVDGAAMAILRLQDTYQLQTSVLADGYFPGVAQCGSMSGKYALNYLKSNFLI